MEIIDNKKNIHILNIYNLEKDLIAFFHINTIYFVYKKNGSNPYKATNVHRRHTKK